MRNIREPSRQQKAGTGYLNYALASALLLGSVFAAKNALSSETKNNAEGGSYSISKRLGGPGIENAKKTEKATSKPERICDTSFLLDMGNEFTVETYNGDAIHVNLLFSIRTNSHHYQFYRTGFNNELGPEKRVVLLAHTYLGKLNKDFLGLQDTHLNHLHPDGPNYAEATVDISKLPLIVDAAMASTPNFEFSYVSHSFDGCFTHRKGFLNQSYSKKKLEKTLLDILDSERLPRYDEMKELFDLQDSHSKIYLFFDTFVAILDSREPTEKIGYGCQHRYERVKLLDIFVVAKRLCRGYSDPLIPKLTEGSEFGGCSNEQFSHELSKTEAEAYGAPSSVGIPFGGLRSWDNDIPKDYQSFVRQHVNSLNLPGPRDGSEFATPWSSGFSRSQVCSGGMRGKPKRSPRAQSKDLPSDYSASTDHVRTNLRAALPRGRSTTTRHCFPTSTGQPRRGYFPGLVDFSNFYKTIDKSKYFREACEAMMKDQKKQGAGTHSIVVTIPDDGGVITLAEVHSSDRKVISFFDSRKPKEAPDQHGDTGSGTENSQDSWNPPSPSHPTMNCDCHGEIPNETANPYIEALELKPDGSGVERMYHVVDFGKMMVVSEVEDLDKINFDLEKRIEVSMRRKASDGAGD